MESDLKSIAYKLKEAFENILNLPENMTSIQKETEKNKIRENLSRDGIGYELVNDHHFVIKFYNYYISGTGVIEDVFSERAFPISLIIESGIFVRYEPRFFPEVYEGPRFPSNLDNSIYINLKKGDKYQLSGRILQAHYFFKGFIRTGQYFEFEIMSESPNNKYQNKNCFIATACYSNIDAEEVKILRNFRDRQLLNNIIGLQIVRFYYIISPTIANCISKSKVIKCLIKILLLNPIVKFLKLHINTNAANNVYTRSRRF